MHKQKCQAQRHLSHVWVVLIIIMISGWIGPVQSQEKYPVRAIDIVVPLVPGGSTDLVGRILASYLNKRWGVPVNVVNKPGGNTVPACLELYNAAPDGYTILADHAGSSSMLPIVVKKLPFKIMDRTFLGMMAQAPHVPIVSASSPFKSLKDLETEAKKSPENFTWTSLGGTGIQDYVVRQFLKAIGVDVLKTKPVMSQGGAQAVTLTSGGHVKMGTATTSAALPALKGGLARPLAITSPTRWPDLPDVATTIELGYPSVNIQDWKGFVGPPNLPAHVVDAWDKALKEMVKDPEIISKLRNIGAIPYYHDSRATREYIMKQTDEVAVLWGLQ
jgi:tripartite-type tricarboxylate transporter receptor subunit TctC